MKYKHFLLVALLISNILFGKDYSPEGKVWQYEGGQYNPIKMIFNPKGILKFEKGFCGLINQDGFITLKQRNLHFIY